MRVVVTAGLLLVVGDYRRLSSDREIDASRSAAREGANMTGVLVQETPRKRLQFVDSIALTSAPERPSDRIGPHGCSREEA
jgi:hypothetical protein